MGSDKPWSDYVRKLHYVASDEPVDDDAWKRYRRRKVTDRQRAENVDRLAEMRQRMRY